MGGAVWERKSKPPPLHTQHSTTVNICQQAWLTWQHLEEATGGAQGEGERVAGAVDDHSPHLVLVHLLDKLTKRHLQYTSGTHEVQGCNTKGKG